MPKQITVQLSSVTDSVGQILPLTSVKPMNVLLGDVTGNKTVNASDIGQTKAQSGTTAGYLGQLPQRRHRRRLDQLDRRLHGENSFGDDSSLALPPVEDLLQA